MKEENDYIGNVECTKSEISDFTVGKIYRIPNPIDNSGDERYISILKGGIWTFKQITKEEFKQITKEEFNQKTDMRTITAEQAQQIIDIACGTWKLKLASIWSKDIVLKKSINITEDDYKEMRGACNYSQNELFDEIFGSDAPKFKVGDWVIAKEGGYPARQVEKVNYDCLNVGRGNGVYSFNYCRLATEQEIAEANYIPAGTPCLAKDLEDGTWLFVYSNGNGKFDNGASIELPWKYVKVLDVNNLPEYSKK